ncbi:MAG TPA: ribosome-associated translation inhibitor RaiA [Micromonosporaceae bacterium]|nr:ribosome-associated translation inhibitor RaiA [Micromonosporaceae bacterium]
MDIVVKGRNVEVPDHYRIHVAEKLAKVKRYDSKLMRIDVELFHERNPRQSDHCQRVEITCISRGPVVRAVACAKDFYSALDAAITKLDTRLRRAADRRRVHPGRPPVSVAAATAHLPVAEAGASPVATLTAVAPPRAAAEPDLSDGLVEYEYDTPPGRIVREKEHPGEPMTVDDALFQMELVGHDFYLFQDKESGRPSVVYRRKGYDYGVISLAA